MSFERFVGSCDWIYCEILPVDEKRMSFEVVLFDDSILYVEFAKLKYQKVYCAAKKLEGM